MQKINLLCNWLVGVGIVGINGRLVEVRSENDVIAGFGKAQIQSAGTTKERENFGGRDRAFLLPCFFARFLGKCARFQNPRLLSH